MISYSTVALSRAFPERYIRKIPVNIWKIRIYFDFKREKPVIPTINGIIPRRRVKIFIYNTFSPNSTQKKFVSVALFKKKRL